MKSKSRKKTSLDKTIFCKHLLFIRFDVCRRHSSCLFSLRKSYSAEFNENQDPVGKVKCVLYELNVAVDKIPANQRIRVLQSDGKESIVCRRVVHTFDLKEGDDLFEKVVEKYSSPKALQQRLPRQMPQFIEEHEAEMEVSRKEWMKSEKRLQQAQLELTLGHKVCFAFIALMDNTCAHDVVNLM